MTSVTGSTTIGSLAMRVTTGCRLDGVPAELIAHGGQQPLSERVFDARSESREQRGSQGGQRHPPLDAFLQRPATFAGIFDVGLQRRELAVFGERPCRQLEQPRADDAAFHPERCDLRQVWLVL